MKNDCSTTERPEDGAARARSSLGVAWEGAAGTPHRVAARLAA
uniref:Uncharacterized protein n=1 Tax=Arundo donax TaxID=35708 RepID=A0A0A9AX06_ARUDO